MSCQPKPLRCGRPASWGRSVCRVKGYKPARNRLRRRRGGNALPVWAPTPYPTSPLLCHCLKPLPRVPTALLFSLHLFLWNKLAPGVFVPNFTSRTTDIALLRGRGLIFSKIETGRWPFYYRHFCNNSKWYGPITKSQVLCKCRLLG